MAQLPVKANTDLSHRPALVAESLSPFTMAFLSSTLDMSLCRQNKEERLQHWKCCSGQQEEGEWNHLHVREEGEVCVCESVTEICGNVNTEGKAGGRLLLVGHLLVVFTPQVQQLRLCRVQSW